MGRLLQHHPAVAHHGAPIGRRWLHAEPQETQSGAHDDHEPDQRGRVDDHRRDHVGQDEAENDGSGLGAAGARRLHIGLGSDLKRGGAHEPRDIGDEHDHDRQDLGRRPGLQSARDGDGQKHEREGEQHIEGAHDDLIDPAAEIGGQQAEHQADHHRAQRRHDSDQKRDARAPEEPGKNIASVTVGTEHKTTVARWRIAHRVHRLVGFVRTEIGGEDRDDDDDEEEDQRDDRRAVFRKRIPSQREASAQACTAVADPQRFEVAASRLAHRHASRTLGSR